MSSMASQIEAAMAADGALPTGGDAAAAAVPEPGGGDPAQVAQPAAAPSTPDSGQQGAPETIPYARFKEVNDAYGQLKDLKPLVDYGYDSDSLGQLAAFHQAYVSDPVGTWAGMIDNLDLPQELKDAVTAHLSASAPTPGTAQGEPSASAPPSAPELPAEVKQAVDYVAQLREREADAARQQSLDTMLSHWTQLEVADGVPEAERTSERMKLNMIAALGSSGRQFNTIEEMVAAAREPIMEHNSTVLRGAVRTGRSGGPLAVSGSAAAPSEPINFGGDIKAASRAAAEAIARGELPGMSG